MRKFRLLTALSCAAVALLCLFGLASLGRAVERGARPLIHARQRRFIAPISQLRSCPDARRAVGCKLARSPSACVPAQPGRRAVHGPRRRLLLLRLAPRQPCRLPYCRRPRHPQWKNLQPAQNTFDWKWLDITWPQTGYGKPDGVGIDLYDGQCCGGMGVPDYVFRLYPSPGSPAPTASKSPSTGIPASSRNTRRFIREFGKQFDGDPRLAFLEVGRRAVRRDAAGQRHVRRLPAEGRTDERPVGRVRQVGDRPVHGGVPEHPACRRVRAPVTCRSASARPSRIMPISKGVGLQHSGLKPDGGGAAIIDDPAQHLLPVRAVRPDHQVLARAM